MIIAVIPSQWTHEVKPPVGSGLNKPSTIKLCAQKGRWFQPMVPWCLMTARYGCHPKSQIFKDETLGENLDLSCKETMTQPSTQPSTVLWTIKQCQVDESTSTVGWREGLRMTIEPRRCFVDIEDRRFTKITKESPWKVQDSCQGDDRGWWEISNKQSFRFETLFKRFVNTVNTVTDSGWPGEGCWVHWLWLHRPQLNSVDMIHRAAGLIRNVLWMFCGCFRKLLPRRSGRLAIPSEPFLEAKTCDFQGFRQQEVFMNISQSYWIKSYKTYVYVYIYYCELSTIPCGSKHALTWAAMHFDVQPITDPPHQHELT
jgi:hypothetical protein